jgi:hypothetical protein
MSVIDKQGKTIPPYEIRCTLRGHGKNARVICHIVKDGRSLCARDAKNWGAEYSSFNPKTDCQRCAKEAARFTDAKAKPVTELEIELRLARADEEQTKKQWQTAIHELELAQAKADRWEEMHAKALERLNELEKIVREQAKADGTTYRG